MKKWFALSGALTVNALASLLVPDGRMGAKGTVSLAVLPRQIVA
jgi:hypothetical protein